MKDAKGIKRLFAIFISMLYISAFTFGGGFVIVTLMKRRFVDKYWWLEEKEMMDMIALSQSAPGPIAVNSAILAGWRLNGFFGMLAAVLGTVIPPIAIISLVYAIYEAFSKNEYVKIVLEGMQAGVAAVLAGVVFSMTAKMAKNRDALHWIILLAALIAAEAFHVNAAYIIVFAGLAGAGKAVYLRGKGKKI